MSKNNLVFFDLETSGLDPKRHEIAEIAAVAVDAETLEVLDVFEYKVQFDVKRAEKEALEVIGYSHEKWKNALPWGMVRTEFTRFLKQYATVQMTSKKGNPYWVAQLVGHNAMKFDGPFLQEQYRKDDEFLPASYQVLDTYALALWWQQLIPDDPGPENLKLGVLAEYLGVEVGETHQAGADVLLTVGIYKALTGKFVMHHIGLLP